MRARGRGAGAAAAASELEEGAQRGADDDDERPTAPRLLRWLVRLQRWLPVLALLPGICLLAAVLFLRGGHAPGGESALLSAAVGGAAALAQMVPDAGRWLDPRPSERTRLLITWGGAEMGTPEANVSAEEALRYAGPLTLLRALQLRGAAGQSGPLAAALAAARRAGALRLWLLGANSTLEPAMAWERMLRGPPGAPESRLARLFGLEVAPFTELNVSVVFCNPAQLPPVRHREQGTSSGYREEFRDSCDGGGDATGVGEPPDRPDIAMALHPGLGKYPEMWEPTLTHLRQLGAPLVVADTGDTAGMFYEFDERVEPTTEGLELRLPGTWRPLGEDRRFVQADKFPGGHGEARLLSQDRATFADASGREAVAHRLDSLRGTTYYAADGRFLWKGANFTGLPGPGEPEAAPWAGPDPADWPRVCTDSEGTLYMARRLGFDVGLLTINPFHYCELFPLCQSSRIVSVLEPRAGFEPAPAGLGLFHALAVQALPCYSEPLQPCLQERVQALASDPAVREEAARQQTVEGYLRACLE